jgi:hypothetical protein
MASCQSSAYKTRKTRIAGAVIVPGIDRKVLCGNSLGEGGAAEERLETPVQFRSMAHFAQSPGVTGKHPATSGTRAC